MIIKEAYRYQNYLSKLFNQAIMMLDNIKFVTSTKQLHKRKKVNAEAEDEELMTDKPFTVDYTPNDLVDFVVKVIQEKQKLSNAIEDAKQNCDSNIDASLAMNKVKQGFVECLRNMYSLKNSEKKCVGSAYKFNAEGNQVPYQYEIDEVTTIDFDRNDVKSLIKKYQKETDEVSAMVDKAEVTIEVDYTPIWDVDTPLDDAVLE